MTDVSDSEAIDEERVTEWVERFRFYRDPPNGKKVRDWLGRFEGQHQEIAARLLDNVLIVSEREIQEGYLEALRSLPGWHREQVRRQGRWFFVGFGGAGESGQAMLRSFREANDLATKQYDGLFCSLSDLPALKLTAFDKVVFVDDFSGTGLQVTRLWRIAAELVASEAECILILTAATTDALKKIHAETELTVIAKIELGPDRNLFNSACKLFDARELAVIKTYGEIADSRNPCGFGNCGLLFVLSHKTPNNSLPILHVNDPDRWVGLFPRYLKVAA